MSAGAFVMTIKKASLDYSKEAFCAEEGTRTPTPCGARS